MRPLFVAASAGTVNTGAIDPLDDVADAGAAEALNQAIPAVVQRRGHAFITGTRLSGATALRACVLHPSTTEADLAVLLREIRTAAEEILMPRRPEENPSQGTA